VLWYKNTVFCRITLIKGTACIIRTFLIFLKKAYNSNIYFFDHGIIILIFGKMLSKYQFINAMI